MIWTGTHILVALACGVAFGYGTANVLYGRNICYECWLALVIGRRFENGCNTCGVKTLNDRIIH